MSEKTKARIHIIGCVILIWDAIISAANAFEGNMDIAIYVGICGILLAEALQFLKK